MEKESILLISPLDAKRFHLIHGTDYSRKEMHTTCINTYNLLKISNIDVTYHDFESNTLSELWSMANLARQLAAEVEHLHSKLKKKYYSIEINQKSWDFLNLYFIFFTVQIFQSQTKNIDSIIKSRDKFSVIWPNFGQDYHFDSTLVKGVIFNEHSLNDKIVKIDIEDNDPNIFNKSLDLSTIKNPQTLVATPTISSSDQLSLIDFINTHAFDENIACFQSPFWDVDLGINKIPYQHIDIYNIADVNYITEYRILIRNAFRFIGIQKISMNQENRLIERSLFQINFYLKMHSLINPKKIIVTNHDGGLLGPLLSLAEVNNSEVHYFPHSSTQNLPLRLLKKCYVHSAYNNKGFKSLHNNSSFDYHSVIYTSKSETINDTNNNAIVLLNDLSEYGFTKGRLADHAANINKICDLLTLKGYNVSIRDKPSCPYENILKTLINYNFSSNTESLAQIAKNTSICIAYESATSAMSFFSREGTTIILASNRIQTTFEYAIIPEEAKISHINELGKLIPVAPIH